MSEKNKEQERVISPSAETHQLEPKSETVDLSKAEQEQQEQLETAREKVEIAENINKEDNPLDKLKAEQQDLKPDENHIPINSELRKITLQKELGHIRRRLGSIDRVGSKVIHQPAIKTISEVSAKTVTRPSGLLGGGVMAFLGTSIYLYLTKHIGITYNYAIFLLLIVAGFILGLLFEALFRLLKRRRSTSA